MNVNGTQEERESSLAWKQSGKAQEEVAFQLVLTSRRIRQVGDSVRSQEPLSQLCKWIREPKPPQVQWPSVWLSGALWAAGAGLPSPPAGDSQAQGFWREGGVHLYNSASVLKVNHMTD